jgi:hypothetical protein
MNLISAMMTFVGSAAVAAMWIWWMFATIDRYIVTSAFWSGLVTLAGVFVVYQFMRDPNAIYASVVGTMFGTLIGVTLSDREF